MPDYRQVARRKAEKYGLDPDVFERQIQQESGFNPNAVSPAGARGIAQIIPSTAQSWGVDPNRPVKALDAAAKNMARYVKQYGSYRDALVAYNAGPGAVGSSSLPAETTNYVKTILGGKTPSVASRSAGASSQAGPDGSSSPDFSSLDGGQPSNGLASLLAQQTLQRPQAPIGQIGQIAAPSFAAGPVSPQGFQPQASVGPAVPAQSPLEQTLAAIRTMGADTNIPQPQTAASGLASQLADSGAGGLLVVGDSLGVGTSPYLKGSAGGKFHANAVVGRTSTASVAAATHGLSSGQYGRVLLDFGSNDGSAQELVQSVRRAKRLAPNAEIFVPEIKGGPGAAQKTAALARIKGITVVPWSTPLGPDGVHPANYQARARELAATIGAPAASGGGLDLQPHGGWGGTEGVVKSFGKVASGLGLQAVSEKRNNTNPYSGTGSDHDVSQKRSYATDFSNGSSPTPQMDQFAYDVMHALGFKSYRKGTPINTSQGVATVNGIRYQVIYRGSGAAYGGNHTNHVHVGARRVG